MKKFSVPFIVLAILLQLFGYYALVKRLEPFMYHFYMIMWWSYILFVDAVLALKTGRYLIFNRRIIYLLVMSSAFWCLFELINVRLQNWFYVAIPGAPTFRYAGYLLAYGTVIPAIYVTKELLSLALPEVTVRPITLGRFPAYAIPLGFLLLLLALLFPVYFFSVAWIFLAFILDGYNYWKGYPSFFRDLERGHLKEIVAAALSGLVCGLLWESWNYWAIAKWIYTVPFFEHTKLFEMPLPGYLGFAFFALETIAFLSLLSDSPLFVGHRWSICLLALLFSLSSALLIDRYTVFSYTAGVQELAFLPENVREDLERRDVQTSYGIDPAILDRKEREQLELIHLKGMGYDHFEKLKAQGIETIKQLASLTQERLSSILEEKNMRRVRVYLRAARGVEKAAVY